MSGFLVSAGWSEDFPFNVTFSYTGLKFLRTNPMGARFVVYDITSDCEGVLEKAIINAAQTWTVFPMLISTLNTDGYRYQPEHLKYSGVITDLDQQDTPALYKILQLVKLSHARLVLNDYYDWSTDDSNNYDIQSVVSHEFGHWLILSDLYGEKTGVK